VVVPVASGSLLTKIWKGFNELKMLGLIEDAKTRVSGAQAEGCSPVASAFREGRDFIKPVKPKTIAKSIAIGNPADGYYSLKAVHESRGAFETATDEETVEGIKLLARTEGIFAETAGGVTIAVLKKLAKKGIIAKDETVVAYVTGNGLKTQEAVLNAVGKVVRIEPSLGAFEKAVKIKEK
jgi:threonine synthase